MFSWIPMRPLLMPALACLALTAQTPEWTAYVENWKKKPGFKASLTLLAPETLLPKNYHQDEERLRLICCGNLSIDSLNAAQSAALISARAWKEPQWILLDAKGEIVSEGTRPPTSPEILDFMRERGLTPQWEALETFLRQHPEHGPALEYRLTLAMLLTQTRLQMHRFAKAQGTNPPVDRPMDPAEADAIFQDSAEALERLVKLPDPWRIQNDYFLCVNMQLQKAGSSPNMRRALGHFADKLQEIWLQHPQTGSPSSGNLDVQRAPQSLGYLWGACQSAAQGRLPAIPDLVLAPNHAWPPALVGALSGAFDEARTEALAFLDAIPLEAMESVRTPEHWKECVELRGAIARSRAYDQMALNRWPAALEAMEEARRWVGPSWKLYSNDMRQMLSFQPANAPETPESSKPPKAFLDFLAQPPLPEPTPPDFPKPLRIICWGASDAWSRLRQAPGLVAWGPKELNWLTAGPYDEATLKTTGLQPPCWVIVRENGTLLAKGQGLPEANPLASHLEALGPTPLQQLDAFIQKHPDHLDARAERYNLVRKRLPNPILEARLAEDAFITQRALDFAPGDPLIQAAPLWESRARKLLPELEAALQRWPQDYELWRAWTSWAPFTPQQSSVLAFADSLPIFGSRDEWKTLLPVDVHQAVIRECRAKKQYQLMLDWFQSAWKGLLPKPEGFDWRPEHQLKQEQAIHDGMAEALKALGRDAELSELEKAWKTRVPKK